MKALFEEIGLGQKVRTLVFLVVIVAVIVFSIFYFKRQDLIVRDAMAYQAVFLDNGQVYFGKLAPVGKNFWSLTDIYYLRTGSSVQSAGQEGTPVIDLIKLGAELHAPKDEMIINREHVVFYEELGENGEVMKLIRAHKQSK